MIKNKGFDKIILVTVSMSALCPSKQNGLFSIKVLSHSIHIIRLLWKKMLHSTSIKTECFNSFILYSFNLLLEPQYGHFKKSA